MQKSANKLFRIGAKTESPIEKILFDELKKYNIHPIPQYKVGVFFIDLAFPDIKLAIEADGHQFHSTEEQKTRDKYREGRITSQGWVFERFPGKFIYNHKDVIAAKIALRYFHDKLTKDQIEIAKGRIVNFFVKKDVDFAIEITKEHLNIS